MEDVNFPLDQSQVSSALRGLQEAREESTRPRRLDDAGEELQNAGQARDDEEAQQTAQAERAVIREDRVDVAAQSRQQQQTRQQDQTVADRVSEGQEVEVQDQTAVEEQEGVNEETLQPLEVAREFGVDPRGGVPSAAEQVTDGLRSGNDIADPNRINEFQNGSQVDSIEEGVEAANEEVTSVEEENPARQLDNSPSPRDVAEAGGAGLQGRGDLEETFNSDPPAPQETARADLQDNRVSANDSRVQQRIQEERVEDAELRVRNEPAIETPAQTIDRKSVV